MSARELAVENGFEYRENKNEIYIDKICDDLGNTDFYIRVDKDEKEIELYFEKENIGSVNRATLTNFTFKLIIRIREELGWIE